MSLKLDDNLPSGLRNACNNDSVSKKTQTLYALLATAIISIGGAVANHEINMKYDISYRSKYQTKNRGINLPDKIGPGGYVFLGKLAVGEILKGSGFNGKGTNNITTLGSLSIQTIGVVYTTD